MMGLNDRWLRSLGVLLALLLVTGLVAACGDDDDDDGGAGTAAVTTTPASASRTPDGSPAASPTSSETPTAAAGSPTGATGELTEVSVALDWYPNANHAGLYVALAKGYFEQEGLDVNLYTPSDPTIGLQLVGAGEDDFAISYHLDTLLARAQGVPVKSVAALVQHPLNSIMTLQSSGIERPSQLAGKKVGMAGLPSDEALLGSMLEADGLTLDDVEMVNVGFDLLPALLGGTVDAIIGAYWTHESILAEQQGKPVNVIRVEEWGVPDYYELVLVTGDDFVAQHPEAIAAFIRAAARGYADAARDQAGAVATLVEASPETDADVEAEGIALLAPLWTDDGAVAWGTQTAARWEDYAAWLSEQGILTQEVAVSEAYTDAFVE
jgi:putative hydroxymethylpyrimidine transport system substrate-binding protein